MGVINLFRTPLAPGEGTINLVLYNGRDDDNQPLPKAVVHCHVLKGGRLHWRVPDFPENRKVLELSYNGRGPGGSTYSIEYEDGGEAPTAPPAARTQKDVAKEMAKEMAAAVAAPHKGKGKMGKGA